LVFDYHVIKPGDPAYDLNITPADGCYIYGLFLDGARWNDNDGILDESYPKILYYKMPYILLIPME